LSSTHIKKNEFFSTQSAQTRGKPCWLMSWNPFWHLY